MKLVTKNLIVILAACTVGVLPACAKINGGISKGHFYDVEKTIMTDAPQDTSVKNEKYWEKNLFYVNKYRPLFMLSNKDLYNLMPDKKISVVQRIATPSVYNISLKTSSIKNISFAPPQVNAPKNILPAAKNISKVEPPLIIKKPKHDLQSISIYEEAKNKGVDSEKKVDTALILKNTNNPSNYVLAIDLLDDVTREEPYNAYAYYLKGELFFAKKDLENAMKNYAEALKLNPYSKQSCIGIAKILEPTNKELAQKYYNMASE